MQDTYKYRFFKNSEASDERKRIIRSEVIVFGNLEENRYKELIPQLFSVWSEFFEGDGIDLDRFVRMHFRKNTRIFIGYGEDNEVAGFTFLTILKMNIDEKDYTVGLAGSFNKLSYKIGYTAGQWGLKQVFYYKLRHRNENFALMPIMTSPVPYNVFTRYVPRVYPHPNFKTPLEITKLVEAVNKIRGIPYNPEDPWIGRFQAHLKDPQLVEKSQSIKGNRFTDFFEKRAPNWKKGEYLILCVPLDFSNISSAICRTITSKWDGSNAEGRALYKAKL